MRDNCKECGELIDDKTESGYCDVCINQMFDDYDVQNKDEDYLF